jgi:hypothetical protein
MNYSQENKERLSVKSEKRTAEKDREGKAGLCPSRKKEERDPYYFA